MQSYLKQFCRKFRKNLRKFQLNLLKIFRKFYECLKINSKFRERCTIFGTLNLWKFYVKYYKTLIQKLKEKRKKILSYCIGHMLPPRYQFYIFTFWCYFLILPRIVHPLPESASIVSCKLTLHLPGFIILCRTAHRHTTCSLCVSTLISTLTTGLADMRLSNGLHDRTI